LAQVKAAFPSFVHAGWVGPHQCSISRSAPSRAGKSRLEWEWQTVPALIHIHCHRTHRTKAGLCWECSGLLGHAALRPQRCLFGVEKPARAKCPEHRCRRTLREQIKAVMRHAEPRMFWRRPGLAPRHRLNGFRRVSLPRRGGSSLLAPLAEQRRERGFSFFGLLLDFELAKDCVPAEIDAVPLGFDVAQDAFL